MGLVGQSLAPRRRALVAAAVALITSTALQPVAPQLRPPTRRGAHPLDGHVPLEDAYPGLRFLHRSPDVAVIDGFLSGAECDALVAIGRAKQLERSPVAYAGWSDDVAELTQTWASGPAAWVALAAILAKANLYGVTDRVDLALTAAGVYALNVVLAAAAALAFAKRREAGLSALRTSKSVALRGDKPGAAEVATFSRLLDVLPSAAPEQMEALTLIRYDDGDRLAPHYDANRAAAAEDATRGGQTLCTLLVYLNDVAAGGRTTFGKLGLHVEPKRGDACVFFPADASGAFDDRLEHEGETAQCEKWIGRVWVHADPILGPTGVDGPTRAAVLAARAAKH